MARPREFDADAALERAVAVFAEHGFEGSTAQMLVDGMEIGRQSLYAAYGDKWQLYLAALKRYGEAEGRAHLDALRSGARGMDGIKAMLARVVQTAKRPCLGTHAVCEFGASHPDIAKLRAPLAKRLRGAIAARIADAQKEGDAAAGLDPQAAADYLIATIAGLRIGGRGGADRAQLTGIAQLALRALR